MVEGRRRGLSFSEWWDEAVRPRKDQALVMVTHPDPPVGAVMWPTDRADRVTWRAAINETKEGWRRAYERQLPTDGEKALVLLSPAMERAAAKAAEEEAKDGIEEQPRLPSAA